MAEAGGNPGADRSAAFAEGPGGIPRKAVLVFVACVLVLGLGGVGLDDLFGGPTGDVTSGTAVGSYPPALGSATTVRAQASQLPASLVSLMALTPTRAVAPPPFVLTDQHDQAVSLAGLRGHAVVLTFFDAACDDICPVLAAELAEAYRGLGPDASRTVLLTVDTDPLALVPSAAGRAEWAAGLGALPSWHFLTGSLHQLDPVWTAFGIGVDVQTTTGAVSHNDFMYFIDPEGRMRTRATPFADETRTGRFALSVAARAEWAAGIAAQVRDLLGEPG